MHKFLPLVWLLIASSLHAQEPVSSPGTAIDKITNFPSKLLAKVNSRITEIEDKLVKQTEKSLHRLAKQEAKLRKKLARKDSAAAKALFEGSAANYDKLLQGINSKDLLLNPHKAGDYLPDFDSLKTMLGFLQENAGMVSNLDPAQLQNALGNATGISNKLKQVATIRKMLKARKNYLASQLSQYGLSSHLTKLNKEIYYYNQYIQHYKSLLNAPSRLEQTALGLLGKIPAFKEFVSKNSFLSSLFP